MKFFSVNHRTRKVKSENHHNDLSDNKYSQSYKIDRIGPEQKLAHR
jgi:hypothetical protein